MDFDHIFSKATLGGKALAILYTDGRDREFIALHNYLTHLSIEFDTNNDLRFRPPKNYDSDNRDLYLSGYCVEMTLKSTEGIK